MLKFTFFLSIAFMTNSVTVNCMVFGSSASVLLAHLIPGCVTLGKLLNLSNFSSLNGSGDHFLIIILIKQGNI